MEKIKEIREETPKVETAADKHKFREKAILGSSVGLIIFAILNFLVILYYILKISYDSYSGKLIKNPLNLQTVDYQLVRSFKNSTSFASLFNKSVKYKFGFIIIYPILTTVISAILIYLIAKDGKFRDYIAGGSFSFGFIIFSILLNSIIIILFTIYIIISYTQKIRDCYDRINNYNTSVFSYMYINQNFLNIMNNIPMNSFCMLKIIQSSLLLINDTPESPDKSDINKVAQALFTINMFIHLQKMGFKNTNISDAFNNVFNYTLLNDISTNPDKINSYVPSDYLFKKFVYMKNYSDKIILLYNELFEETTGQLITNVNINTLIAQANECSGKPIINTVTNNIFRDGLTADERSINTQAEEVNLINTQNINNTRITADVLSHASTISGEWISKLNDLNSEFNPGEAFNNIISILVGFILLTMVPYIIMIMVYFRYGREIKAVAAKAIPLGE
jgi:hypothetical protein